MRNATRRIAALLLVSLATLLSGCWDLQPLENLAIISTIGIDTLPEDQLEVTVDVTNPATAVSTSGQSSGAATQGAPSLIYTVQGRSLNDALAQLDLFKSRRPSDIQTRILLIGEQKAREGFLPELDSFLRFLEFRRTIRVFVVEGRVSDVLRNLQPDLEVTPTAHLEGLGTQDTTARIPVPLHRMHDFLLHTVSKGREAVLPLLRTTGRSGSGQMGAGGGGQAGGGSQSGGGGGGDKKGLTEITGLAVFRGGNMVGKIGVEEFTAYNFLTGQTDDAYVTIEGQGGSEGRWLVTAALEAVGKPDIQVERRPDRDLVEVSIKLDGPIVEVRGGQSFSHGWLQTQVEPRLKAKLTRDMQRLVERAQSEWRSDIFGFGKKIRGTFRTWKEWKDYPWTERFPEAEVKIDVQLNFQTTGRHTRPPSPE